MRGLLLLLVAAPGVASAICLGLSFAYSPEAVGAGEHLGAFRSAFVPCSGCSMCGMSRAFAALSHFDLSRALHFNAAVVVAWPSAWLVGFTSAFGTARLWRQPPRFFAPLTEESMSNA